MQILLQLEQLVSLDPVGTVALGWAWAVLVVVCVAILRARRLWRCRSARGLCDDSYRVPREARPRALLLRPFAGAEPALGERLLSVARAKHTLDLQVCLAASDEEETALPIAVRSAETLSRRGIACQVQQVAVRAPNRKAAQLAAAHSGDRSAPELLIVVDSDIDLSGYDLDALVAPLLDDPSVGACWAPFVERPSAGRSAGDKFSAAVLRASLQAFPLLAALDKSCLVSKVMAIRTADIERLGGFGGLSGYLAEDMELARRITRAGLRIVAVPELATASAAGRSATAALLRFSRWLVALRTQRPLLIWTYPLLFCLSLPLGAIAVSGVALSPLGQAAVGVALSARLLASWYGRKLAGLAGPASLGGLLRDTMRAELLLTLAFLHAVASRRAHWRGRRLVIGKRGLARTEG